MHVFTTEAAPTPPNTDIIRLFEGLKLIMPRIRRSDFPKGTFFITCTTHKRVSWFADNRYAQIVVRQWHHYEREYEFQLHTICLMPNHYHAVLSEGERKTLSQILHAVNSYIVTSISRNLKGIVKPRVFHGNPWIELIMDEKMYWQKVAYTLFNPWRDGLVGSPVATYQFSDISRWIEIEGIDFMEDLFAKYKRWYEEDSICPGVGVRAVDLVSSRIGLLSRYASHKHFMVQIPTGV